MKKCFVLVLLVLFIFFVSGCSIYSDYVINDAKKLKQDFLYCDNPMYTSDGPAMICTKGNTFYRYINHNWYRKNQNSWEIVTRPIIFNSNNREYVIRGEQKTDLMQFSYSKSITNSNKSKVSQNGSKKEHVAAQQKKSNVSNADKTRVKTQPKTVATTKHPVNSGSKQKEQNKTQPASAKSAPKATSANMRSSNNNVSKKKTANKIQTKKNVQKPNSSHKLRVAEQKQKS